MRLPTAAPLATMLMCGSWLAAIPPQEHIARVVAPYIEGEWCMSAVVGMVDAGGRTVTGFGRISSKNSTAPDARTIYEIGSITKPLTALLLAQMHLAGEVGLEDPIAMYLPQRLKTPATDGGPITLLSLATHRSGLPRLPGNFRPATAANPYADYTAERLYEFLESWRPLRKAGEAYEYSNLGFGLLGHVLSLRANRTYEQLLLERICAPLKLTDTLIVLDEERRPRLAPGHDADGNPAGNWDFDALAGCGAVRSTGRDMTALLAANLGLVRSPLGEAIRLTHTVRAPAEGPNDMALGWLVNRQSGVVWHNGQTGGYHCCVMMDISRKLGVAVLSNTASTAVDRLAADLLLLMQTGKVPPPGVAAAVRLERNILPEYAGVYVLSPGVPVVITHDDGRLYAQVPGQRAVRLYPAAPQTFSARIVAAQFDFKRDATGRVAGLVLRQDGVERRAVRIGAPATSPSP